MNQNDKADIMNALSELKDEVKDLNDDVDKIRNQLVTTTENGKFKVAKTITNRKGELEIVPASEKSRKVFSTVMKQGSVTTQEFNQILMDNGVNRSLPTVRNIMRRYANEFNLLELREAKKGVRKCHHLQKT